MAAVAAPSQTAPGAPPAAPSGVGLTEMDFKLITDSGLGDGLNSYTHSMSWFENRLYVGFSRAILQSLKTGGQYNYKPWPTLSPEDNYDVDRRGEIWQYTPETERWKRVYQAMWISGEAGRPCPRFCGYRGMTIYQGPHDHKPCLYVATWAVSKAGTPTLLRTEDGEHFELMPRPSWDTSVRSFRSLQVFKGRVHTSPTGATKEGVASSDVGGDASVFCTQDIRYPDWGTCSPEGFGDKRNVTIFEMGVYDNHLYASVANPWTGLQIWKTDGEGGVPYKWKKVIERGAGRGPFNEGAAALIPFKGALYVATGVANGGFHRDYDLGPAAPELIRLWPDDSWDLIVGYPRTTSQGLKVPLSGYSGGFDHVLNGYIWRLHVHDGWLYAGTFNGNNNVPYLQPHIWPEDILHQYNSWGWDHVMRNYSGCELWRTNDGIHWENVTRNGFGNRFNWGIRNMASTPHGLFVGTANAYGSHVALEHGGRWNYFPNPRGGVEIWLGKPRTAARP